MLQPSYGYRINVFTACTSKNATRKKKKNTCIIKSDKICIIMYNKEMLQLPSVFSCIVYMEKRNFLC